MPMNCTGLPEAEYVAHAFCRSGVSATHGAHHEPHTLSTTTLPRAAATDQRDPASVVPARSSAGPRSPGASRSIDPSPDRKFFWSPERAWAAIELLSEPHAARPV